MPIEQPRCWPRSAVELESAPGFVALLVSFSMGQTITVTARPGAAPTARTFDTNRSLTGMALERYAALEDTDGIRPPDVLARRLFELGATGVTVYSNVVQVDAPVEAWGALEPKAIHVIEHLFGFYGDDAGWSDEALRDMGIEPYPRLFEANQS